MSDYFRFLGWSVYKDSKKLIDLISVIVNGLPKEYRFEFGSQVIRSSFSVALNISEGSNKHSDKDFNNFLNISLGSLSETVACCDIFRSRNLISNDQFNDILILAESISKQLGGFKKKLLLKKIN
jgi:four helix bundle protein